MAEPIIKEGFSKVITSFVYFNSLIRDTLEYTIDKPTYEVRFYKARQNGIKNEPIINSPLHQFIQNNGEKGQEFLGRINDFYDLIYSEDSTIVREAADGLRVDRGQAVAIFEAVSPLHEEINSIINLHIKRAKEEGKQVEPAILNLIAEDDRFYRATVYSTVINEIVKQFQEFNKIMAENKGQKSPASNFIEQDLNKLFKVFMTTKHYGISIDNLYKDTTDAVFNMLEMMMGKRALPEGKTFPQVFNDVRAQTHKLVVEAEQRWVSIYKPCIDVLIEDGRARQEKAAETEETAA